MEVRFEDGQQLEAVEARKALTRLGEAIDKKFRERMKVIRAARDERDFYALKSLHFEKMKGDRAKDHSMKLNKQWRLVLRFDGEGPEKIVLVRGIEDYH